jgi:hypothetical protein
LAAHLGRTDRVQMLRELPASEFRRWKILEGIEPFGVYGEWLRTGLMLSLVANIHRKPGTFAYSAEDFMPETMRAKKVGPAQSPEQIYNLMMLLKAHQDAWLAKKKGIMQKGAAPNGGSDTGARSLREETTSP